MAGQTAEEIYHALRILRPANQRHSVPVRFWPDRLFRRACVFSLRDGPQTNRQFLSALFSSKRAERSNSVRARLLLILVETLGTVRVFLEGRPTQRNYAFSKLANLSPFGTDAEFQTGLHQALSVLPARIFNRTLGATLTETIAKHKAELAIERFGIAVAYVPQELRVGMAEFLNQLVADTQPPASAPCRCSKCRRGSAGRSSGARVTARGRSFYE